MKKTLKLLLYTIIALCLFTSINAGQDPQKNQLPNYDDFQIAFDSELNTLFEELPQEQANSYLFAPPPIHEQSFMNFGIAAEPNSAQLFFNPFPYPIQNYFQSGFPIQLSTELQPNPIATPQVATFCAKRKQSSSKKETKTPPKKKALRHVYTSTYLLQRLQKVITYECESKGKYKLRIPIPGEKEEIAKALAYLIENTPYENKKELCLPCLEPLCKERLNKSSLQDHVSLKFSLKELNEHLENDCYEPITAYTCQDCKEVFNYFSLLAHHHLTKHNKETNKSQASDKESLKA